MIINIPLGTFGGPLRNGDMVGVANVVEYFRKTDDPNTKFHLLSDAISSSEYCQKFYNFLLNNTDYFSSSPGDRILSWENINLWDFRGLSGDIVKIPNNRETEQKIVVFPIFNASYNTYRNWPKQVFSNIIEKFKQSEYSNYRKIICTESSIGNIDGWEESTDFIDNLEHIMTSDIFLGGETGTSIFASALERSPREMIYLYSGHSLLHTTPFYSTLGKGRIIQYWHNSENLVWN